MMQGTVNGRTLTEIEAQRQWSERLQIDNFRFKLFMTKPLVKS